MTRIETEEESAARQEQRIPTPAEFAAQAKASAAAEVYSACRRIVHEMRKAGDIVAIVLPLNRDESKRASLISERFEQTGWLVETGDDQRDGPWIRLRMPKKDT